MEHNAQIQAVKRDKKGTITHFKMDNGQVFDYSTVVRMAEIGQLTSVAVMKRLDGRKIVYNHTDGPEQNNFDNFPLFE